MVEVKEERRGEAGMTLRTMIRCPRCNRTNIISTGRTLDNEIAVQHKDGKTCLVNDDLFQKTKFDNRFFR